MTWEIWAGLIACIGALIGILTPIIKLSTAIAKLTTTVEILNKSLGRVEKLVDETPADYGAYVGYPYDQIVTALNTLSGRCVVDEIFGTFSDASEREMDDIRAKLRAGAIF